MLGEAVDILFELVPLPTMIFDADTLEFIAVNRAAVERYGYSRDQFAAMNVRDIRPARERIAAVELIRALPAGPYPVIPAVHQRRDGTLVNVEITSQSLLMPHRRARVAIVADVKQRTEAAGRMRSAVGALHKWRSLAARYAISPVPRALLSARECEVLVLVAEGFTNQQAADRLAISVKTVETYRGRLMRKLALENRADLVRYALQQGFLGRRP